MATIDPKLSRNPARPVIYQLLVRTFGNTNETRKPHGTMAENGCGKFSDINEAALRSLKRMGFTHLWLTGVLEQASATAYPGRPADDPDILKGQAGSPYAIKDYFDVCPDYAVDPDKRVEEFQALLVRCRVQGFRVIIDFVPNHVSRGYDSDARPELSFGRDDDRSVFFDRDNHFYYLPPGEGGPPLKLPTSGLPGCDGIFEGEIEFGRVTGNDVASWSPSIHDWYETVKLNYGHDFTCGRDTSHLPGPEAAADEAPRTWRTMDEILAFWQKLGVDGFRVDMAHMVPMEYWRWQIRRARQRNGDVFFMAEAYDNDPAKLTDRDVLMELLDGGFNAVYEAPTYRLLEGIYDSGKWANDLDAATFDPRFHASLRYVENHDEVRIANPREWGGVGAQAGKPASAVQFAMARGPVMIYHGQEVGEPAIGDDGFAGDNARTTIFDYWSMPEFAKWVNGGRYDGGGLSREQKDLREWYARLIRATQVPAFTKGEFFGLNHANKDNAGFGRMDGETVSGHWLYAFLRRDPATGQSFLISVNFHPTETMREVSIALPPEALEFLGRKPGEAFPMVDRLAGELTAGFDGNAVCLPRIPPCDALLLEI